MYHGNRRGGVVLAAVVVIVAVAVTGCQPIWQAREMEEDLAAMEQRQAELEEEALEREEELAAMIEDAQSEIDELEEVLDEARSLLQRDSAELGADVRQSRQEISRLRGQLEELEFRYGRLEQSFQAFRTDFDRLFDGIEADELLELAEDFTEEGEYDMARRALERFVEEYDDHELVLEAHSELGDVYFELEMWESAGAEFSHVRENTTSEALEAYATRRGGDTLFKLGSCERAQVVMEALIEGFPNSDEVPKAQERLEQIEAGECPP